MRYDIRKECCPGMMGESKQYYKSLDLDGFKWFGFINGLHHFSKKVGEKYAEMRVTSADISDGSALEMARVGLSR